MIFWHTAGVMLIGMALYRRGFFTDARAWCRGGVSLCGGFVIEAAVLAGRFTMGLETSAAQGLFGAVTLAGILMGIGYMSLLIPVASGTALLVRALRNAGKTAFTLYISQTVVSLLLFNLVLRPLWGTWSRLPLLVYVLLFAVVQVIFAHWWQTRRGIGSLEGMWRRLATVSS